MPTPFYHLSIAQELLQAPQIPESVRCTLSRHRGAFLFGNTAPDAQTVSGQSRRETHFFEVPPNPAAPLPWDALLARNPDLGRPGELPGEQAAFWAGYLCHLQADWLWIRELYLPVFGPQAGWSDFGDRLFLHNVLRSYLDQQYLASLVNGVSARLQGLLPSQWVPFVPEAALVGWRDFLVQQLQPGGAVQTVEVFAARAGLPVQQFYALLEDDELLQRRIFSRLPRAKLERYRERLVHENCNLVVTYLNTTSGGDHASI